MSTIVRSVTARGVVAVSLAIGLIATVVPVAAAFTAGGYVTRTKTISIAPSSHGGGRVACPTGYRVVAGGASLPLGDPPYINRWLGASLPIEGGKAWYAAAANPESGIVPAILTIRIHCLPVSVVGTYVIVKVHPGLDGFGASGAYAACPVNHRIVTGGAAWRIPGDPLSPSVANLAWLASSSPTVQQNGWYGDGRRNGASAAVLSVHAYCLPKGRVGATTLVTATRSGGAADLTFGASCPPGKRVVAAGSFVHKPGVGPDLEEARSSPLRGAIPGPTARGLKASGQAKNERSIVLHCRAMR